MTSCSRLSGALPEPGPTRMNTIVSLSPVCLLTYLFFINSDSHLLLLKIEARPATHTPPVLPSHFQPCLPFLLLFLHSPVPGPKTCLSPSMDHPTQLLLSPSGTPLGRTLSTSET
ncbi:unnamed protein product [Pleuronectes platessa]|uniref:Uncharacterized protein n=1 Tax=Pleuronectes platessa TaxID=8262 RepID=A0A9N7VMA4_PLEPL|nr:unnamed protein product [Pleuronectes platessa]